MQHILSRFRLVLARRPWLYWLVVVTAACIAWAGVHSATAAARARADAWGRTTTVLVATAPAAPGAPIVAEPRDYPVAVVPAAVAQLSATELAALLDSSVAARAVSAGEIVVPADIATANTPPPGWLAVAVPAEGAPLLVDGAAVALFGNGTLLCDGLTVATGATAPNGSEQIEVAIPAECAPSLTAHLAAATLSIARHE